MSSTTLNRKPAAIALCDIGRHTPVRAAVSTVGDVRRSVCSRCGCSLVRTGVTRSWIRSGMLG